MARSELAFEKVIGGWRFTLGEETFLALRNEAGFAHRDWELWRSRIQPPPYGMRNGEWECVEDQLATRAECVDRARRV